MLIGYCCGGLVCMVVGLQVFLLHSLNNVSLSDFFFKLLCRTALFVGLHEFHLLSARFCERVSFTNRLVYTLVFLNVGT